MWCIPKITKEYKERMLNILDLYEKPYDPEYPIICFDEKSKQLIDETRESIPACPGRIKRTDYEYKRNGTTNIFVTIEPKGKFRTVRATKRRTRQDFAKEIKRIIRLKRYNNAKKIHIVLDNLNTHFEKSFYETFSKTEAEIILKRIEFHYTPKHASWLNMAEIEINVLSGQCLNQKIPSMRIIRKHIAKWSQNRNRMKKGINWQFTRKNAEKKFKLNKKNNEKIK